MAAESKSTGSERTIALIDVDHTLVGDIVADFDATGKLNKESLTEDILNPAILSTLDQLGIKDIYLFTDMKFTQNALSERERIVELLAARGLTVHGVITPADRAWQSRLDPRLAALATDPDLPLDQKGEQETVRRLLPQHQNYQAIKEMTERENVSNLGIAFREATSPAGRQTDPEQMRAASARCKSYLDALSIEQRLPHAKGEMFKDFLKYKSPEFQRCIVFDDNQPALSSVYASTSSYFPTALVYVNNYINTHNLKENERRKTVQDYVSEITPSKLRKALNGLWLFGSLTYALFFDPGKPKDAGYPTPQNFITAFRVLNPLIWATITFLVSYFAISMSIASNVGFSIIAVVAATIGQSVVQWRRGHKYSVTNDAMDRQIAGMATKFWAAPLLFAPNKLFAAQYRGLAYFLNIVTWGVILFAVGYFFAFGAVGHFITRHIPLDLISQPFGFAMAFGMLGTFCAVVGQAIDAIIHERGNGNHDKTPLGRLGTFIFNLLLYPQGYIKVKKDDGKPMNTFAEALFRSTNAVIWAGLTMLLAYNMLSMIGGSGETLGDALLYISIGAAAAAACTQAYFFHKAENLPPPAGAENGAVRGQQLENGNNQGLVYENGMLPPAPANPQNGTTGALGAASSRLPGVGGPPANLPTVTHHEGLPSQNLT